MGERNMRKLRIPKLLSTYERKLKESWEAGRASGWKAGHEAGKADAAKKYAENRLRVHLVALETLTKLGNTHGQLMEQINRAMQSEKDQL